MGFTNFRKLRRIFGPPDVARLKAKRNIERLVECLDDEEVQWTALAALKELRDPRAIPGLAQVITNGRDIGLARAAVEALGLIRHPTSIDALLNLADKGARLISSKGMDPSDRLAADFEIWGNAAISAAQFGDRRSTPFLLLLLRTGSADLRCRAIRNINVEADDEVIAALAASLSDDSSEVRAESATRLLYAGPAGLATISSFLAGRGPALRLLRDTGCADVLCVLARSYVALQPLFSAMPDLASVVAILKRVCEVAVHHNLTVTPSEATGFAHEALLLERRHGGYEFEYVPRVTKTYRGGWDFYSSSHYDGVAPTEEEEVSPPHLAVVQAPKTER